MKNTVLAAIKLFFQHPSAESSELAEMMVQQLQISQFKADVLVALIPIAFGRTVINSLNKQLSQPIELSQEAFILRPDVAHDEQWIVPLQHIREYVDAIEFSENLWASGQLTFEQFYVVAGISAELNALQKAMQEKGDLEVLAGARFGPVGMIFDESPKLEVWYQQVHKKPVYVEEVFAA